MQQIVLQPWITVRGNGVTLIQDEGEWIETGPFQDMFFYIDVREVTGNVTIAIETSPNRDDALFQASVVAFIPAVGLNYKQVILAAAPNIPISHWTRWKAVMPVGGTNDITFRVLANGNSFC